MRQNPADNSFAKTSCRRSTSVLERDYDCAAIYIQPDCFGHKNPRAALLNGDVSGNLISFSRELNGLNGVTNGILGSRPKPSSDPTQPESGQRQKSSESNQPPFSRRIPLALTFGFGGFGFLFASSWYDDRKRRVPLSIWSAWVPWGWPSACCSWRRLG